jgi:hypothetical protein
MSGIELYLMLAPLVVAGLAWGVALWVARSTTPSDHKARTDTVP